MANNYKEPRSPDEYISDSRTGHTAPYHASHGMRHDATDRDGQTILATGPSNAVGRSCFNVENSMLDTTFGGGVDNTEIDVLLRDHGGRKPHGPVRVNEEVGHRGAARRSADGFGDDRQGPPTRRGFIVLGSPSATHIVD
jgi:hypothetical protein